MKAPAPGFDIAEDRADWEVWLEQWEAFLITSGIARLRVTGANNDETEERQAVLAQIKRGALFSAFSTATIKIVNRLNLNANQKTNAANVIRALGIYIDRKMNKRVYRRQLAKRVLQPGESIEAFVVAQKDLSARCKFTTVADPEADRLLDAFIANVNDKEVTERLLQLDNTKSYEDAVAIAQTILTARSDAKAITGSRAATTARLDGQRNWKKESSRQASGTVARANGTASMANKTKITPTAPAMRAVWV